MKLYWLCDKCQSYEIEAYDEESLAEERENHLKKCDGKKGARITSVLPGKGPPNPWWRCTSCKQVYKMKFPWAEEIPRPPDEEIPEVGCCVACLEKSRIEREIKEKGFYQPKMDI